MFVQVVTYGLEMNESEYLDVANDLAPRFSGLSGLLAKVWLEDPDRGRYGALYLWEDKESMERFLRSDLFEGTNPEFVQVDSEGFAILENLTAQTQPSLELVESRRPAVRAAPPRPSAVKKAPAPRASTAKKGSAPAKRARKSTKSAG